jgi:signal transduction histidine kinase
VMSKTWGSLRVRLILTYLVIFLFSCAVMVARAGSLFARTAIESAQHDLEVQAYVMASSLERPWSSRGGEPTNITLPQLNTLTDSGGPAQVQLNFLNSDGDPLATSLTVVPPNQSDQPEVADALKGRISHAMRYNRGYDGMAIFAAAPVQRSGQVYGVVQISVPVWQVTSRTASFWSSLGVTALLAAALAALAAWWLADQIARPIARLRDAATRLASGSLDERVAAQGFTEVAQLSDAFNHMAARIQDMLNRQRDFVANASHELRTPLTNIRLRAEALGNGALQDPMVAQRFVGDIENEATRLGRLANDLLALSRQDAQRSGQFENLAIGPLIVATGNEMALRAEHAEVKLNYNLAPDLPEVTIDAAGIRTVLTNLLDNALQYTSAGGTITMSARCEGRWLRMTVADSGAGIPAEDLPHIFERFYRADKAHSRRTAVAGSGAGLGLAIVRGIIEEHGGKISALSKFGEGTTVVIDLPLNSP